VHVSRLAPRPGNGEYTVRSLGAAGAGRQANMATGAPCARLFPRACLMVTLPHEKPEVPTTPGEAARPARAPDPAALKAPAHPAMHRGRRLSTSSAVTRPTPFPRPTAPAQFIAEGHHGTMAWLEAKREPPRQPAPLWPEVGASGACLASTMAPDSDPLASLAQRRPCHLSSVYARHRLPHLSGQAQA